MTERRLREELQSLVRRELRDVDAYTVPKRIPHRVKLDSNESPFGLPPEVAEALARELAAVELNRYPYGDCRELRQVVAAEIGVDESSLVFGNGSGELVMFLLSVFATPRPGRERAAALYPMPSFVFYRSASLASGATPVEVPLADDFSLDEDALDRALSEQRPNVAFFARPNNPTGTLWSREAILRVARAHPDMLVVVDEAYIDYGGDTLLDELSSFANLVVLRTLSKLGLAALRVGYLCADLAVVHELEKVRPPYNVGALNQRAAAWLLANHGGLLRDRCRQIAGERDRLAAALAELPGVRVYESRANLLLVRVGEPGDGEAERCWEGLAARGVLVRMFHGFDSLRGCLRITVGDARENQILLDAFAEVLE